MVAPSAAEDVPRAACREQSDVVASEACQPTDAVAPLARSEGEAAYRAPCPAVGEAACQRADSGAVTLRSLRGKKVTDSRINGTPSLQRDQHSALTNCSLPQYFTIQRPTGEKPN